MTAASLNRELCAALVDEVSVVVGAMIDSVATVTTGAPPTGRQWVADVGADGAVTGTITVVLDAAGAEAMARLMTGVDGDMPEAAVRDTLNEVFVQAIAAVACKPISRGATLSLAALARKDDQVADREWTGFALGADKLAAPLALAAAGRVSVAETAVATAPSLDSARDRSASTQPGLSPAAAVASRAPMDERIEVLLDIDLPLVVRFGHTQLPLRQLTKLGPGSVIDLGRSADDPVELLVSNRVVARGEVVIVSGSYGVRILDVVSQRERVSSMEG